MPNGKVKVSVPPTSKHLLKFMRENAAGIVPEDGVALYPLPDTSIQDDAFSTALSARSQAAGRWTWALHTVKANDIPSRIILLLMFIMFLLDLCKSNIF